MDNEEGSLQRIRQLRPVACGSVSKTPAFNLPGFASMHGNLSEQIAQRELLDSGQSECLSVDAKLAYIRLVLKRSERISVESD
jgi:hypothetical protein